MKSETRLKMLVAILGVLLVALIAYVAVGKLNESQKQKMEVLGQQAYQKGYADAVVSAYTQTGNCQVATITIYNQTRQVVDVTCIKESN